MASGFSSGAFAEMLVVAGACREHVLIVDEAVMCQGSRELQPTPKPIHSGSNRSVQRDTAEVIETGETLSEVHPGHASSQAVQHHCMHVSLPLYRKKTTVDLQLHV